MSSAAPARDQLVPVSVPASPALSSAERWLAAFLLGVLLILKLMGAFHFRIDSDEPQHLHTVWAWAHGQIAYRDVFDNHMPLFQYLCAPLFRALGERANIVSLMRLAMIPLFFGMLWCVFRITAALHSARAGLWAMLFAGFCPGFFFVSSEFRTDDLWSLVWLLALLVLLRGPLSIARALGFGLLTGVDFAVSMKTTLLLGTLALAVAVVLLLRRLAGEKIAWNHLASCAAAALAGSLLLPLAVAGYFWAHGAWTPFVYCVFQHNVVPGVIETGGVPVAWRPFYFPLAFPFLVGGAWWMLRRKAVGLALLWLAGGFYLAALWSYWPILSAEDYEPFFPLLYAVLVPLAFLLCRRLASWPGSASWQAAVFLLLGGATQVWVPVTRHPWRDDTVADVRLVADALRLTTPDQYVMDGKCESIFRPRPYYYVLETMTDARLARGLLKDDISAFLIDKRVPLALLERLPVQAHRFVHANYVPVTPRWLVLGKFLAEAVNETGTDAALSACHFDLAIPARYAVIGKHGEVAGVLDGKPFAGPGWIEAGRHSWQSSTPKGGLALVWADAVEKGYTPFTDALESRPWHSRRSK